MGKQKRRGERKLNLRSVDSMQVYAKAENLCESIREAEHRVCFGLLPGSTACTTTASGEP